MRELIFKYALKNALDFGNANPKAVIGKVIAENPDMRKKVKDLFPVVEEVIEEVNSLSRDEIEGYIKSFTFEEKERKKEQKLQELKCVEKGKVVMRFAPNPSGPLHMGHARAAVLNSEYVKYYGGKLILRFEDTDPARVMPKAYNMIREDLRWLGIEWDKEVVQSSRLEIYYKYARELIEKGFSYVCTCTAEEFQKLKIGKVECPHRNTASRKNLENFERMFSDFNEGDAVLRFKSGVDLPDPAMREFPLMRISEKKHPLVEARVYPLMNFSVTVDDHLLGLTHVLRGKDHIVNTRKQEFIYNAFGWEMPEFIHYGRLKIGGLALSTSKISEGIRAGLYSGWEDAKLGTLRALRKRGLQPEAIVKTMLDVGVKQSDINFSWENLYSYNRAIIEPDANRYFFVAQPKILVVENAESVENYAPFHPDYPERGKRRLVINADAGKARVLISSRDFLNLKPGNFIRLMGAFNIEILEVGEKARGIFRSFELGEARKRKARLIHWLPEEGNIEVKVVKPEGIDTGFAERLLEKEKTGSIVQFERYGFCRIDEKNSIITLYFTHE